MAERERTAAMNAETTWVARFLDERAIQDIEPIVEGLPVERLAEILQRAVAKVDGRARRNGHARAVDLEEVDWELLAERYSEMFS